MVEFWLAAFGLFLVIEGLVPTINPSMYKDFIEKLSELPLDHLRVIGLSSMIVGALLITFAR